MLSGGRLPRPGICTDDPSEKMGKRRSPKHCFGDLLSSNRSYRPAATMQFSTSVRITKMAPTHLVALASLASTERALLRLM